MQILHHTRLVFVRSARPWMRSPIGHIVGISGPLVYLILFGPLLEGTLPKNIDAWQWFVPGMLMQLTLFGAAYAGFSLTPELRSGVMERLRVAPVSRGALLFGRVLSDMAQLAVQGLILMGAAMFFGFHEPVVGVVLSLLLVCVLAGAISSASYALALKLREENKFAPLLSMLLVPLMLLSGVLLPMEAAPDWLHNASRLNPLSHVVEALRAFAGEDYTGSAALNGTLAAFGLLLLCGFWGMRTMTKKQS
ncbi:ABC transporter permease [Streptomyces sp. NPDC054841]